MVDGEDTKGLNEDKLRDVLRKFSVSIKDDSWIFYLWIIQNKAGRTPPTPENINPLWYSKILSVRNNREFRECYVAFKTAYDYVRDVVGEDFWNKNQHAVFERRYNGD